MSLKLYPDNIRRVLCCVADNEWLLSRLYSLGVTAAVATTVGTVVVSIVCLVCTVYCCCRCRRHRHKRRDAMRAPTTATSVTINNTAPLMTHITGWSTSLRAKYYIECSVLSRSYIATFSFETLDYTELCNACRFYPLQSSQLHTTRLLRRPAALLCKHASQWWGTHILFCVFSNSNRQRLVVCILSPLQYASTSTTQWCQRRR